MCKMGILRFLRYLVYFQARCSDEARVINRIKSQLLHWFTCNHLLLFIFNIHT